MEIGSIQQEINELLVSITNYSNRSSETKTTSHEINLMLTNINSLHEKMSVLKYVLDQQENESKQPENTLKSKLELEKRDPKVSVLPQENSTQTEINNLVEEKTFERTKLESVEATSLIEDFEHPPIPKLVDALTLNDRYLYANELFNKDMNLFNELVKSIDKSSSLTEAKQLLDSYNWDKENEHVASFYILVDRRFL